MQEGHSRVVSGGGCKVKVKHSHLLSSMSHMPSVSGTRRDLLSYSMTVERSTDTPVVQDVQVSANK